MSEHEASNQKKQGKIEQKRRAAPQGPEPVSQSLMAWDISSYLIGPTPFNPPVQRHAALLSGASEAARPGIALRLQQTYGNRYVQHLVESVRDRAAQRDFVSIETGRNQSQPQIARTPGADESKGTITIRPVANSNYNVTGSTLEEVSSQLDPEEWGRCTWTWNRSQRTTAGVADRINITLGLSIRMPRWTGAGWRNASGPVKAEWNRMIESLRAHEDHHAEIARTWPSTIQDRLINQPEGDLDSLWTQALADHQQEQDTYDTDTSHGETEGVTLDLEIT